jgi:UDP-glucose 4-epimerase
MRAVVFGHSGFIGKHVTSEIRLQHPNLQVVLPSVDLTATSAAQRLHETISKEDVVIVCAGVKRQWGDTLQSYVQNSRIHESLAEGFAGSTPRRVIYLSSAAVYGESTHTLNCSEESPIHLLSYYAIAKYAGEALLHKVVSLDYQGELVILRPPLVYGAGDSSEGYGPAMFVKALQSADSIRLWGDGSELREFLYVKDLARIVSLLVKSTAAGIINPVSGVSHSFRDVVTTLEEISGRTFKVDYRERSRPKNDVRFNNRRFRSVLPDFSFKTLSEGLRETIQQASV